MTPFEVKELQHCRWRHRTRGYEVIVTGVLNHGNPVVAQTVKVDRRETSNLPRRWDMTQFLTLFDPIGDPNPPLNFWEALSE